MRRRSPKPGTPLNQKQEELAQRESKLRGEVEKLERMIAEAPRVAEETSRRQREELLTRASEGRSRLDVSIALQDKRWGYDGRGIWVDSGCAAAFAYQGGGPSQANRVRCESRNYERNFCEVQAQISRAWLLEQESEAACVEGQTWGARGNGIWVNQGCSGVFAFDRR